jgi:membrane protein DedA with SNARE-associated domain
MTLQEAIDLIAYYGDWFYLITFVWTFLEGETFVIFAGIAATPAFGILRLDYLIACAWIGSFCGDNLYFYLGRRYGHRIIARFPRLRPGVDVALELLHKYNTGFILSFRFIYVVRNFSSFACGMSDLFWPRFMALNFVAAGLWACTFAGAGYILGEVFTKAAWPIKIAVLCLFVGLIVLAVRAHRANKRRIAEMAKREAEEEAAAKAAAAVQKTKA